MVPLKTAKVRENTHCSTFACMPLSVSNPTMYSFKFLRHKNIIIVGLYICKMIIGLVVLVQFGSILSQNNPQISCSNVKKQKKERKKINYTKIKEEFNPRTIISWICDMPLSFDPWNIYIGGTPKCHKNHLSDFLSASICLSDLQFNSDPVPPAPIPRLFTLISHILPHQPVVCILGSICINRTQINYSARVHHNEETGHPVQQSRSELWSRGISYLRLWPHRKYFCRRIH